MMFASKSPHDLVTFCAECGTEHYSDTCPTCGSEEIDQLY